MVNSIAESGTVFYNYGGENFLEQPYLGDEILVALCR